jgi:hypothetical protein
MIICVHNVCIIKAYAQADLIKVTRWDFDRKVGCGSFVTHVYRDQRRRFM